MKHDSAVAILLLAFCTFLLSCGGPETPSVRYSFDFSTGAQGWIGGSAEYPVDYEPNMDIHTEIRNLPYPLDQKRTAYYLGGWNFSDDLYVYVKKHITDLKPNRSYQLTFTVTFATQDGEVGVAMGIQTGATRTEPNRIVVQRNDQAYYVMNVDKGVSIGNSTKSTPGWQLKTLRSASPLTMQTDSSGSIWLLVGADSNWESLSRIYITNIEVQAREN
ncbi:MAG: hypothetical protein LAO22_15600 [Acidobacteriia bacterium]|nr:hypothetical protein [Terriglobia bacterium]